LSESKKSSFYVRNVTENVGATMLHHCYLSDNVFEDRLPPNFMQLEEPLAKKRWEGLLFYKTGNYLYVSYV